jgi:hypothetical protein
MSLYTPKAYNGSLLDLASGLRGTLVFDLDSRDNPK